MGVPAKAFHALTAAPFCPPIPRIEDLYRSKLVTTDNTANLAALDRLTAHLRPDPARPLGSARAHDPDENTRRIHLWSAHLRSMPGDGAPDGTSMRIRHITLLPVTLKVARPRCLFTRIHLLYLVRIR